MGTHYKYFQGHHTASIPNLALATGAAAGVQRVSFTGFQVRRAGQISRQVVQRHPAVQQLQLAWQPFQQPCTGTNHGTRAAQTHRGSHKQFHQTAFARLTECCNLDHRCPPPWPQQDLSIWGPKYDILRKCTSALTKSSHLHRHAHICSKSSMPFRDAEAAMLVPSSQICR